MGGTQPPRTLLLLSKVLLAIRKGSFKPDCTRSGRFVGARSSECIEIKDEDESPGIAGDVRTVPVEHVSGALSGVHASCC